MLTTTDTTEIQQRELQKKVVNGGGIYLKIAWKNEHFEKNSAENVDVLIFEWEFKKKELV